MAREYAKLNLNKMTRVLSKLNKSELIDSKKVVSKGIRTAQSKAKESNCYYCGTPCSSFCNSHTIPAFSLRNIAQKGKLFSANKVIEMRLVEMEKGVKAAGTFQIICKSCDNTIFQEYENPENYLNEITSKMLAQIHLKNTLKMISQRKMEIQLYANIQFGNQGKFKNKINQMDLTELEEELAYAKRKINKSYKGDYQIIFHKKLDYVIPIAFQGAVVLPIDLKGAVINNIYNANPKHKMKWIQMAILPMEATSEIILFVDKGNIRYREFRKQLNSVDSLEKKLSIINNIIFLYSEGYFISPTISEEVLDSLKSLADETSGLFSCRQLTTQELIAILKADKDKIMNHNIPNLLSKQFELM